MHSGYFPSKPFNIYKGPESPKRKQRGHQTIDEKINMIYDVVVGKEKLSDVAMKYHQTKGYVSVVLALVRKNRELLRELIAKRDHMLMKQSVVQKVI